MKTWNGKTIYKMNMCVCVFVFYRSMEKRKIIYNQNGQVAQPAPAYTE